MTDKILEVRGLTKTYGGVKKKGAKQPTPTLDVLKGIAPALKERKSAPVLISMVTGPDIARIQKLAGGDYPVIRIMPNMPAAVGEGVIFYACSGNCDKAQQEAFLRYIRSGKEFADEEHRRAWLIRATINCSKTLLSSAWFRKTSPLEDTLTTELEEKSEVYYAVMDLPVKYRTVIHLYYYEDLSVSQISGLLKTKETTVKSQLHRARSLLKETLKGELF